MLQLANRPQGREFSPLSTRRSQQFFRSFSASGAEIRIRAFVTVCVAAALAATSALAAPAQAATWTDRGEYDLVMGIRAEASAQKRVDLLDRWQAKYPQSDLRQVRRELYLAAFEALSDSARMLKTAREMLAEQADNPVGVYWCTLLVPEVRDPSADALGAGEKAARQLLAGLDTYFAAAGKPAAASDAEWQKRKSSAGLLAHRTLGWIAWQRGDFAGAAKEFRLYLDQNANSAEITAWMGLVSGLQKEPANQVAALWYLERAGALRGEGALPDGQQRAVGALADQVYTAYHGDGEGIENLKTAALASAVPPPDFRVEAAAAVAARRADEELTRTNPQLAAWVHIRRQLESPDGDKYLTDLRASPLPKLKGIVIRSQPEAKPAEIVIGISQPLTEEVVLRVSTPFPNPALPGTELEFEGTVDSFGKQPFTLTVLVDREKITGWPEPPRKK